MLSSLIFDSIQVRHGKFVTIFILFIIQCRAKNKEKIKRRKGKKYDKMSAYDWSCAYFVALSIEEG